MIQRSDGRYMERIYIGNDNGKTKYKYVYGNTAKEVEQKADEIKRLVKKGIVTDKTTFAEFLKIYLATIEATKTADRYNTIKARLEVFAKYLGNKKLLDIKQNELQIAMNKITAINPYTGKPSSVKTMIDYRREILNLFENATDNNYIEKNPAKKLVIPKTAEKPKERRMLTEQEREYIINFEHRGQLPMMIMMLSGLRKGELTALKWSDIDLDKKTISVTKSYDFKSHSLKPPKNGKSRLVSIPDKLVDYLRKQPNQGDFVIISAQGKMMTETAWKRLLESYLCDLNCHLQDINKFAPKPKEFVIEPFTYHCLRHTFCSLMYEADVDILTAQQQMGHSSPEITMQIYTHLGEAKKINSIDKLNAFLK